MVQGAHVGGTKDLRLGRDAATHSSGQVTGFSRGCNRSPGAWPQISGSRPTPGLHHHHQRHGLAGTASVSSECGKGQKQSRGPVVVTRGLGWE